MVSLKNSFVYILTKLHLEVGTILKLGLNYNSYVYLFDIHVQTYEFSTKKDTNTRSEGPGAVREANKNWHLFRLNIFIQVRGNKRKKWTKTCSSNQLGDYKYCHVVPVTFTFFTAFNRLLTSGAIAKETHAI